MEILRQVQILHGNMVPFTDKFLKDLVSSGFILTSVKSQWPQKHFLLTFTVTEVKKDLFSLSDTENSSHW